MPITHKAFYVIRKDLTMTPAKLGVQIGHGTDMIHIHTPHNHPDYYKAWIENDRAKIVCGVSTLEDLERLIIRLVSDGITGAAIVDHGYTEFNNVKTKTGIVIFPLPVEAIPNYVKRLQLLKTP
jgi:peptidyl-tRNA hydrolase